MTHLIVLTKTYNIADFKSWLLYHAKLVDKIYVLDNDSSVDINNVVATVNNAKYLQIKGWPDQYGIYDKILNENTFGFKDDDFILFIDDDEYIYFDINKFNNLTDAIKFYFKDLDSLLVPQILMSTKRLMTSRSEILPLFATYRRNDFSTQGKAIVRYNSTAKYQFKHSLVEQGHVPKINGIRLSEVVSDNPGHNLSKTTYGITGYDCGLRLYHYHIKSMEDWQHKFNRGSAAKKKQWYDENITKNKNFGDYDVPDLTLYNIFKNELLR